MYFLRFSANLTSFLIPTRSLRLFFRFLSRSQRFVGQVSSFCFRRCVAYGEALEWYHSSPRLSKSRAIRWPVMSRATEATTQHPLERSRRDPVELPTMRTKHIRTWSGDLVEQCWAGWVHIRVERWCLPDRCMPRPRTHCGLRVAGGDLVHPSTSRFPPHGPKRREKTIHYQLLTIN